MLKDYVTLTQTDTTVGFISKNATKLSDIKNRDTKKEFLRVVDSLKTFKKLSSNFPKKYKNTLRRSKKTTFIVNSNAFRVVKDEKHLELLKKLEWAYSTSANERDKSYDEEFCYNKADLIIEEKNGFFEGISSSIFKVNTKSIKRLR
ncbi:MAG: Sua5 YciO YrdC YwlC family protein [Helicobacteraceae bacterium]|nr:Sua5 YciO YrdC YwlC family protein [Helicobacteraceae bacterium]